MNIKNNNNYTPNFEASFKINDCYRRFCLTTSKGKYNRLVKVNEKLDKFAPENELLLSRKQSLDKQMIPVITNLKTGAMVMLSDTRKTFQSLCIELAEKVANIGSKENKIIFSNKPSIIKDSIKAINGKTSELNIHPPKAPYQLTNINLDEDFQMLIRKFDKLYSNKEIIFSAPKDQLLLIKRYDEGYLYYLTDKNKMPNGKYFSATYNNDGFQLNFDKNIIGEGEVLKYFKRYTNKYLERFL